MKFLASWNWCNYLGVDILLQRGMAQSQGGRAKKLALILIVMLMYICVKYSYIYTNVRLPNCNIYSVGFECNTSSVHSIK